MVGPVCESGDFLARDRELPPLRPGELIALRGAGAYAAAMASHYNSRPFAAEVLVDGGERAPDPASRERGSPVEGRNTGLKISARMRWHRRNKRVRESHMGVRSLANQTRRSAYVPTEPPRPAVTATWDGATFRPAMPEMAGSTRGP